MAAPEQSKSLLSEFLKELEGFSKQIGENVLKAANDEDEKSVIRALIPSFEEQVMELCAFTSGVAGKGSRQQLADAEQVVRMSSGTNLIRNARSLFPSLGSVIGKLGLGRIIQEIKKIIQAILDIFGITLPAWLNKILLLIDEIINFILSAGSVKIASALSTLEQNYLRELTELAKLDRAKSYGSEDGEDDN